MEFKAYKQNRTSNHKTDGKMDYNFLSTQEKEK